MLVELSDRQAEIAQLVREHDFLSVDDLSERFDVTTQTIRRDLATLCDQGLARRRHGGIAPPMEARNISYGSRQVLARGAKLAIAHEVARRVDDGASLAFSIGTTPQVVAEALLHHKSLKIFTNNLNIAMLTCENPTFEVNIVGGRLRNGDRDVLGSGLDKFMSSYMVDIGVYGAAGVADDGTLLDFHEDEVKARRLIRDNSRETYLVLDHTKFGRTAHVRGGNICEATKVFCECRPPDHIVKLLNSSKTELIVPNEERS